MASALWKCHCGTENPVTRGWCEKCHDARRDNPDNLSVTLMANGAVIWRNQLDGTHVIEFTQHGNTLRIVVESSGDWRLRVGPMGRPGRAVADGRLKSPGAFDRIRR